MIQVTKELLISAICGTEFKSIAIADKMEALGLARFAGNGWNYSCEWNKDSLAKLSLEQLEKIYIISST